MQRRAAQRMHACPHFRRLAPLCAWQRARRGWVHSGMLHARCSLASWLSCALSNRLQFRAGGLRLLAGRGLSLHKRGTASPSCRRFVSLTKTA